MDDVPVNQAEFHCDRFLRRLKNKSSMLKKVSLHLKRISSILIPKSSKLHRYVKKVIKLCNTRYKCNHKHDPKIFYAIKVTVPKKTYLLSFSSLFNHTYVIMKPKCNCTARRYLSLFSCNSQSRMTNYLNNPLRRRDSARSVAPESLYGGQFTLSTQLIKLNYLAILPPTQHHSFFRNLTPFLLDYMNFVYRQ